MTGVAVIGTGVISESHIEAYLAFQDRCRIIALCDLVPKKAEALKEKYHLKDTAVYSDCKEMAERSDICLVSICTPPFTHGESAVICMKARENTFWWKSLWRLLWKSVTR